MKIDIIAVGRLKQGPYCALIAEYTKRIRWNMTLHIHESKHTDPRKRQREEEEKILRTMHDGAVVIVLDERGKSVTSVDFAGMLDHFRHDGQNYLQFIIGGADGLTPAIRDKADRLLGFGKQTWPHMLVRVMVLEQIYRAEQILVGHPYHRG